MNFTETLNAAIADLTEHGFDDLARVQGWILRIREAAARSLVPESVLEERMRSAFQAQFRRLVDQGGILKYHPGVSRFTVDRLKPALRRELDRRMMASRDLIRLNRTKAVEETTQRFAGWATSIPPGGTDAADKPEVKATIKKSLQSMPFVERRLNIDQGHKFLGNLNGIIATDAGAIAARWHSHYRRPGYNYREEHKDLDGEVFVMRGNWAMERGLMKLDGHLYTDQIEAPGFLVYCSCYYEHLYSLRQLPQGMLTQKGREELARVRALVA